MRTDLALAALASAAVPGMKPVAVAGISDDGRSEELQSALVEDATGRRWIVRSPLTPVAGARLQRNDELVRQLSRHVPFKVPAAAGYAPVGKDGSAAVYPYVEGSPLDLRRLPAGPGLGSAVGRALAAVHNIPRAVFEEQDVPVFDAAGTRQRAIAEVDRAAETGRVPTGLLARWEEAFEAAPLWQFATTPVHGSFTGASVVVAFTDEEDAASGRVVAVTDWDEAMVGDPATDLAELWAQAPRPAWDAVLESYALARAHRPDPYLSARARLVAELRSLRGLARAVAEGDEDAARRIVEALRRMDRLTEADDSLVPVTARPSGSRPPSPSAGPTPSPRPTASDDDRADGRVVAPGAGPETDGDRTMEVPPPPTPTGDGFDQEPPSDGDPYPGTASDEDTSPGAASDDDADADPVPGADGDPTDLVEVPEGATGGHGPDAGAQLEEAGAEPQAAAAPPDDDEAVDHEEDPAGAAAAEPADPSSPEAGQGVPPEAEDLEDEDRLHELYGMPVDPDTSR
ncbi:phosphotransferase [Ornithinimicrobium humiphilum]|nr:phosphotransferase [Ornithinimicrobium humiphilum]